MAREHDAVTKAKTIIDLSNGLSIGDAARRNNVPKGTVQDWHEELKRNGTASGLEAKQNNFQEALERFGLATMRMLEAQAELLSDPAYISTRTTDDLIKHTEFINRGLHGYIRLQAGLPEGPPALEPSVERVEAELVED